MDVTENQGFSFFRQLTKTTQKLLKNLLVRIKNRLEHCGISFLSKSGIKKPFFIFYFFKLYYFVSNYIAFIIKDFAFWTQPKPALKEKESISIPLFPVSFKNELSAKEMKEKNLSNWLLACYNQSEGWSALKPSATYTDRACPSYHPPPPAFYPFLMAVCRWGRGGGHYESGEPSPRTQHSDFARN